MNSHADNLEVSLFLEALYGSFGIDFRGHNAGSFKRKLEELALGLEVESISALQGRVLRDQALARKVVRKLIKSEASYFADASLFMALRCAMLPVLRSSPWPAIWIADCFDVKLVVLMLAFLEEEGLRGKARVIATSASEALLDELAMLKMTSAELDELSQHYLRCGGSALLPNYFEVDGGGAALKPELTTDLFCYQHDISTDSSFSEFQAIVCTRPMDHYGADLQRRALGLFADSLCPFGILQIDLQHASREGPLADCFATVLGPQGIYRRSPG